MRAPFQNQESGIDKNECLVITPKFRYGIINTIIYKYRVKSLNTNKDRYNK